ncbi:uncharacterized protein LOC133175283 [Saccostrea echinata]|uniref:uncharacterized protein LOC133175283 n=1 Tax=Saccostrea echinata TaxID=191078 RepID=UPI002A81B25E|nr:uncharacterized protein LOC133175283 [Saccostrea echinata]
MYGLACTREKVEVLFFVLAGYLVTVHCQPWIMVFRGASGRIGGSNDIYKLWSTEGTSGLSEPRARQIGSRCSIHYKNKLVDEWRKMIIHGVKLAIYKDGREMKNIIFESMPSTDKSNWFKSKHLNSSSFSDLNKWGSYTLFGIEGDSSMQRRFVISNNGGRSNDIGDFWFGIFETQVYDWERNLLPTIMYSPSNSATRGKLQQKEVGENNPLTMQCNPGSIIHIYSARYGRGGCWGNVIGNVLPRCPNQERCVIGATNAVLGDQCPGIPKLLQIKYSCVPHIADEFAIYVKAEDQSRIENCVEKDLDCYLSTEGHCKRCNSTHPVKLYNGNKECAWLCSQENRHCWPGTCGADNVAKDCQCDEGFFTEKDASQAQCIMTRQPTIETCFAGLHGVKGEHVTLRKINSSSACKDQKDNFINFQPARTDFTLQYAFTVTPAYPRPTFIKEYKFGIGGGSLTLQWKQTTKGNTVLILDNELSYYGINLDKLNDTVHLENGTVLSRVSMENGDGLCYTFKATGKGYLQTTALHDPLKLLQRRYYNETVATRDTCFWFDNLKPVHCKVTGECKDLEIIQMNSITKSPVVTIGLEGWKDSDIFKGKRINASGIRQYEVSVYSIGGDDALLQADLSADKSNTKKSDTSEPLHIEITSCGLFEIHLEVVDNSGEGNVQIARRFVLFDNCSNVQKNPNKNLFIATADINSNRTWQTQKRKLCFDWTGRFFNTLHKKTNLLKPIKRKSTIAEDYEDNDYPLPRNGTANIDGIVELNFTITLNGKKRIVNQRHENVLIQKHCASLPLKDGDSVTVDVVATDIMGNFNSDSTTVFIDTSVPEITNMGLNKGDFRGLFVHNTIELSKMKMILTIRDVHSGIKSIQWYLGTRLGQADIGDGTLAVNRLYNGTDCINDTECYCPFHGPCEKSIYSIDMSKLMTKHNNTGQHNRDYFFTFVVTNNAFLQTVEHLDILVDESAPVKGVVREGAPGEKDNDFTNENNTVLNWDGFIDHESGIRSYKVVMFSRCLRLNEILSIRSNESIIIVNTTKKSARLYFPKKGKYFTSVIAFNNAGESSDVACSDGITYDMSPVQIFNLAGQRFITKKGIACDENDNPFIILDNLTKIQLKNSSRCTQICRNFSFPGFIKNLPQINNAYADEIYSEGMCEKVPPFNNQEIYVPSDKIEVSWEFRDLESQLDDFLVGFGQSDSEYLSPSLLSYTKTLGRPRYINYHPGLRSAEIFWMYIKSINKAGVEETVRVGPMIIDSTPVVVVKELDLVIENGNIYIGWENDTFIDQEETDPINSILFRIGKQSKFVTPFLQHYRTNDCPRSNMADCIIYPIERLHPSKTENSAKYLVEIIVTNKAGHIGTTKSRSFWIPSQIPPGPGVVIDTDTSEFSDMDYILYPSKLCVKWKGFEHHENITFEVGVGTKKDKDNVIRYTQSTSKEKHCFDANVLEPFVKYYSLVKASSYGGQTVVSSDGITFIHENFTSSIQSYDGKGCPIDTSKNIILYDVNSRAGCEVTINKTLKIGKIYSFVFNISTISINSSGALILKTITEINRKIVIFIAKSKSLKFSTQSDTAFDISFHQCNLDIDFTEKTDVVTLHWTKRKDNVIHPTRYIVKLKQEIRGSDDKLISMKEQSSSATSASFENVKLIEETTYFVEVSPCFGHICLNFTRSDGFVFHQKTSPIEFKDATLNFTGKHKILTASWEKSIINESKIQLERWTLSFDAMARDLLLNWTLVTNEKEVNQNLGNFIATKRRIYFCLQNWLEDEHWFVQCTPVIVTNNPVENNLNILDIDLNRINRSFADFISRVSFSKNLGNLQQSVHDLEIDYCTPDAKMSVLILGHDGEDLDAFLMTSPETPETVVDCKKRLDCLSASEVNKGIAKFTIVPLTHGTILFSCIRGKNESYGCSDGFFVDSTPPRRGQVTIQGSHGFITSLSDLSLNIEPFIEDAKPIGEENLPSISYYEYGIGTMARVDDVLVWQKTTKHGPIRIQELKLNQGETYYLSVSATNRAGLKSPYVVTQFTVDISPPDAGKLYIGDVIENYYISNHPITVHWRGFADDESNIMEFECGLVSNNGEIIVPFTHADVDSIIFENIKNLIDGHSYRAVLKVTNHALLSLIVYSHNFTVDTSPTHPGTVFDSFERYTDEDYQTSVDVVCASWNGFSDPHSDILGYYTGLGNNPNFPDVKPFRDISLRQDYCWKISLTAGQKYFTFVKACNRAMLCSTSVSDGIVVDNSPPLAGIVYIKGVSGRMAYLHDRTSIMASWVGFEDPHSSVEHFEWCIGTKKENCDILPYRNSFLSNDIYLPSLWLPLKTDLFVSVMAFNNVNLTTNISSHAFRVDETPPIVISQPKIHTFKSPLTEATQIQYDDSILKLSWLFSDKESRISHHFITLSSHHNKKVPYEGVIHDNVNTIMIPFNATNRLLNGDRYSAVVTACNQAGLCTVSESQPILIDSSPPHLGGFTSEHLWQVSDNQTSATISWFGFQDVESDIAFFKLSVGHTYNGGEFTNGFYQILGNQTSATIPLYDFKPYMHNEIILSIYAINHAGLKSRTAKATVLTTMSDKSGLRGRFLTQRYSCKTSFCNNDCTCGVVGLKCRFNGKNTCREVNNTHTEVFIGSSNSSDILIQSSTTCIAGSWRSNSSNIKRYEWTVGLVNEAPGQGIFDLQKEDPWTDNDLETSILFCLPAHKTLENNQKYILYVRAWVSGDEYGISKSKSITIKDVSPRVRRGKFISESRNEPCGVDIDFAESQWKICACWKNVFSDADRLLYTFRVGTSPKLDDVLQSINLGNQTEHCPSLLLEPGVRYFFTVRAVNNIGLYTTLSSDGFLVDDSFPTSGVVFNSPSQKNKPFFSSKTPSGASWIGFTDTESFIRNYSFGTQIYEKGSFHLLELTSTNFSTSSTSNNLKDGSTYRYSVQASDAAGHGSALAFSPPFTVDNTEPSSFYCKEKTLILRKLLRSEKTSFNISVKQGFFYTFNIYDAGASWDTDIVLKFEDEIMRLPVKMNANGSANIHHGILASTTGIKTISVLQEQLPVHKLNIDIYQCYADPSTSKQVIEFAQLSPVMFQACIKAVDPESGIQRFELGIGTTENGTQIKTLADIGRKHHFSMHFSLPHGSPIFSHVVAENAANLQNYFTSNKSIADHTPPFIEILSEKLEYQEVDNSTLIKMILQFRSEDIESGIKFCRACIKNIYGAVIYPCETTASPFVSNYINATHGTKLVPEVICVNEVELQTTLQGGINIVSIEKPSLENARIEFLVPDPYFRIESVPVQSDTTRIDFRWFGFEDDSEIISYDCKLQRGSSIIQNWISVDRHDYASFSNLVLRGEEIYTVFIRARNSGGWISPALNASVRIDLQQPVLTGSPAIIQALNSDGVYRLDWGRVFVYNERYPTRYDISVGTSAGSSDILRQDGLVDTTYDIDDMEHMSVVYVVVRASFPTSTSKVYTGRIVLK